jgi:hypothetical protein
MGFKKAPLAAPYIFELRHWLQMIWVYTAPKAAEVI